MKCKEIKYVPFNYGSGGRCFLSGMQVANIVYAEGGYKLTKICLVGMKTELTTKFAEISDCIAKLESMVVKSVSFMVDLS